MPAVMEQCPSAKPPSPSPAARPESFRASCDSCAKSKVRCGKEQPRCQRCIYQGGRCVYSPSQRSRKRKPSLIDQPSRPRPGPIPAPRKSAPQCNIAPVSPPQSDAGQASSISLSTPARSTNSTAPSEMGKTPEHEADPFVSLNLFDTDLDSFIKLENPIARPSDDAHRGASVLSDQFQTQHWLHGDSISPSCLHDEDIRDMFARPDDPLTDSGLPSLEISANQAGHQHWMSLAFSTLQSVDIPTTCCSSFRDNLDCSSSSGSPRSLDTVLRVNQAAIDNVLAILSCPCTADTNSALLVTIIVFKMLSWYQASLNCSKVSGSTTTSSPFASSCGSHESSLSPVVESVFMPPITIGAYQLDDEHRGRMMTQLILTELVKLNEVVDGFSRKYGRSRPLSTEDSKTQLHFALEMFLRSRVKMSILAAREQLDQI